jgi:hypothetical protein
LSRYYQVAGLIPGQEIVEDIDSLRVNISQALRRPLAHSDADVLESRQKGEYIWASGGGTFLLNGRYLLAVRRSPHARVNPGKYSLFTGRADSKEEMLNPVLLIRELFEELVLQTGEQLYKPVCDEFQGIIDHVYAGLKKHLGLGTAGAVPLRLSHLACAPRMVSVVNQQDHWEGMLDYHVSKNGEINFLFVLSGDIDIGTLRARDGEFHIRDGKVVGHNRDIYMYDLRSATGRNITGDRNHGTQVPIPEDAMTEHLHHMVQLVKRRLANDSPGRRSPTVEDKYQP